MNPDLLLPEVQDYLRQHEHAELSRFILSGSPFNDISIQELAQQLEGFQKTRDKLPTYHGTPGIYFPPKVNLEQTSGETAAAYKASLVEGKTLADLTGGLGVDSYFFSKKVNRLSYCEINASLAKIAAHNFKQLEAKNISVQALDGMEFLEQKTPHYDWIYLDPSRRDNAKGKVFLLQDCEPNVLHHLDFLLMKAERILIKTSPLFDLQAALNELSAVSDIHIVAVKNEVKELLFILKNGSLKAEISLFAVNITAEKTEKTALNYNEAREAEASYAQPGDYLYEPNAALMKSGMFNWLSEFYKLDKLHPNTQLYTSHTLIEFPGRRFKIKRQLPYSKKAIARIFKGKKANITTRNFRESVAALRKKFNIRDGGEQYLFFTTCADGGQWVLVCSKEV